MEKTAKDGFKLISGVPRFLQREIIAIQRQNHL
jgi:hypothetical protein